MVPGDIGHWLFLTGRGAHTGFLVVPAWPAGTKGDTGHGAAPAHSPPLRQFPLRGVTTEGLKARALGVGSGHEELREAEANTGAGSSPEPLPPRGQKPSKFPPRFRLWGQEKLISAEAPRGHALEIPRATVSPGRIRPPPSCSPWKLTLVLHCLLPRWRRRWTGDTEGRPPHSLRGLLPSAGSSPGALSPVVAWGEEGWSRVMPRLEPPLTSPRDCVRVTQIHCARLSPCM